MTASVPIREHIQKLDLGTRVELFELDLSPITGTNTDDDHVYFHAGTNDLSVPVVWQGKTYQPFAIQASGFERTTKGVAPRPKLQVANIQSAISALVQEYDDLVGSKIIRRVTYARYLDEVNFPDRVNLIKFSEEFNQWALSGCRVASNVTYSPNGELSADKIIESNVNEAHYVQSTAVSVVAGELVTASISACPAERRRVRVQLSSSAFSAGRSVTVDLLTGEVVSTTNLIPGNGDLVLVEKEHAGWYRVHITARADATGVASARAYVISNVNTTYVGDNVSGVLVACGQLNKGGRAPYEYQGSVWYRNPEADPNQHLPDDVYFVERKVVENPAVVEFELASPMDIEDLRLPAREITAYVCTAQYRGPECGYTGNNYFDGADQPVSTLAEDVCSQATSGCKARFGNGYLPFNGFPATKVYKS